MNRIYEFAVTREEAIKDAVVADDIDQLEKLLTTASSLEIDLAFKLGAVHNNLDAMEAAYSIVEDPTEVMLDAFDIPAEHGHLESSMYTGNYFGRWHSPEDYEDTWLRDSVLENAV
ncbi:hypothetical protein PC116_g10757 [Phytophthora cactorum]|uniref:Uncharacterized protein n=1 Tax=Phytophthora cactorum TaxID=29920 RepID=A0A329S6S8_9STRA|nr:hypothetical protein PC112_g10387 [Phytophthora cactorum]KAG2825818.1 hypothetical protein PC111_g9220 [Phytophthora cactorum]KAG2988055.1 hypothetical protein PC118_g6946 [Phytophthora cactorum]KAG3013500.1 hypothetical protein PC120_g13271 [Phytophthora cactorum]KAG3070646.1 hypothetical protein PC121_g9454 [Phytophthora cactorum]